MALAKNSLEGKAEAFLGRIERLHKDLDSERGKYMKACRPLREDISEIYKEAKGTGVPAKALRQLVKYRQLEKQKAGLAETLDIDEQAAFETLIEALGPLGQAAADKAGFKQKLQEGIAKGDAMAKGERPDAANLENVGRGKIGTAPSTAHVVN